jgi:hypothetical protein
VTSPPIKSVAADANVLLAAIAARAAARVFEERPALIVVTTEITLGEVHKYIPEFARRYGLDIEELHAVADNLCAGGMPLNPSHKWDRAVRIRTPRSRLADCFTKGMNEQSDIRDMLRGMGIRAGVLLVGGLVVGASTAVLALKAMEGAVKIAVGSTLLLAGAGVAAYEVKKFQRRFEQPQLP